MADTTGRPRTAETYIGHPCRRPEHRTDDGRTVRLRVQSRCVACASENRRRSYERCVIRDVRDEAPERAATYRGRACSNDAGHVGDDGLTVRYAKSWGCVACARQRARRQTEAARRQAGNGETGGATWE
jgi:hypothetical protein